MLAAATIRERLLLPAFSIQGAATIQEQLLDFSKT